MTTLAPFDRNYQSSVTPTAWTRLTWDSADAQNGNIEMVNERTAKLTEMAAAGKCDSRGIAVTPVIAVRPWRDVEAAQEFATFMTALAAKYNAKLLQVEVLTTAPLINL
jgi:hypothetical protein